MENTRLEVEVELEFESSDDTSSASLEESTIVETSVTSRISGRNGTFISDADENESQPVVPVTSVYPIMPANIAFLNIEDLPLATVLSNEGVHGDNIAPFIGLTEASWFTCSSILYVLSNKLNEQFLLILIGFLALSFFIGGLVLYTHGHNNPSARVHWKPAVKVLSGTKEKQYLGSDFAISHDGTRLGVLSLGGKHFYQDNGTHYVPLGQKVCFCEEFWGLNIDSNLPPEAYEFHLIGFGMASSYDGNRFSIGVAYDSFGASIVIEWDDETSQWKLLNIFLPDDDSEGFAASLDISHDGHRVAIVSAITKVISIYDDVKANSTAIWIRHSILLGEEEIIRSTKSKYMALSGNGKRLAIGNFLGVKIMEEREVGEWEQVGGYLYGANMYDKFGDAVALSEDGGRLVVGAPGFSEGYVMVFDYSQKDNDWKQIGSRVTGNIPGDRYGFSVSISSDGTRLAIGAFGGGPGSIPGYVVLYEFVASDWFKIGGNINGNQPGDRFGFRVQISPDKNRVIASAILADVDTFDKAGRVFSYDFEP